MNNHCPHILSLKTKLNYILLLAAVLRSSPKISKEQLKIFSFLVTSLQMPRSYDSYPYLQQSLDDELLEHILRNNLSFLDVFLLDISILLGVNEKSYQVLNTITNQITSLHRCTHLKNFSELHFLQSLILGKPCDFLAIENIYPIKKTISAQKKEYKYKLHSKVKKGEYIKKRQLIFSLEVISNLSHKSKHFHIFSERKGIFLPYQSPQLLKSNFNIIFLLGFIIPISSFARHYYPFLQETSGSFATEDFTKNMNFLARQLRNKE